MTREEAKNLAIGCVGIDYIENIEKVIDEIYEDFAERRCGNCVWAGEGNQYVVLCQKFNMRFSVEFGCKDFEEEEINVQ